MSEIKLHRNLPQLLVEMMWCQYTTVIWGRGTGKTEGPAAQFAYHNIHELPRSNGFILGTTYSQIKGRTLPALQAAWEKLNFLEDKHYWVGKMPPKHLLIEKPYRVPKQDALRHYISTYTGTGIYMFSQDLPGISNGARTHWGLIDEAKFIDKAQFDQETIPTMIAAPPVKEWKLKEEYKSLMFLSDMPNKPKSNWLLKARDLMKPEIIEKIMWIQKELIPLMLKHHAANPGTKEKLNKRITELKGWLSNYRIGAHYFSTATTLDNIDAVGLDSIQHMLRTLSDFDLQLSVFNKEMLKLEENFYSILDEDKHGYNMDNHSFIDKLIVDYRRPPVRDCRWDADIVPRKALNIACDYNNKINCVITGQHSRDQKEFRFLSSLYVLSKEGLLKQCVQKWHLYYRYHQAYCKVVHYWYDNTAVGKRADTSVSFADQWVEELQRLGWIVVRHYIGQASTHEDRKNFIDTLLQGSDPRLPKFRFNKTNAASWQKSAELCGIRYVGANKKLEKDKRPEADPNVPPEQAPHLSEAGDTLLWGMFKSKTKKQDSYVP